MLFLCANSAIASMFEVTPKYVGFITNTALASGLSFMARSYSFKETPFAIPVCGSISGYTKIGTAPLNIKELTMDLWTFLGRIILSFGLKQPNIIVCIAPVVPFI